MLGRQVKVLEAFRRTVQFVHAHEPPGVSASYARLRQELETAVEELEQHAVGQDAARRKGLAATRALHAAERSLRERHLRPLAAIARALEEEEPGIVNGLRLPGRRIGVTRLVAEASAIRSSAVKHARLLVDYGRHPEFLSQIGSAIEALQGRYLEQARALGNKVGSTAALAQGMMHARRLVMLLECQIVSGFIDDHAVLAEWRSAKRVQLKQGGGRREEVGVEVTVSEADVVPVFAAQMLMLEAPKPQLLIAAPRREKVAA